MFEIYNEDCLTGMKRIADGSIDAIICDPPFGHSTDCDWDVRLPMDEMWAEFNRVTKHNAAIVLFSQLPFAVDLINANRKMFRYEWIFEKSHACGFFNANKMPLRAHADAEGGGVYRKRKGALTVNDGEHYYPRDVIKFTSVTAMHKTEPRYHPTQKPLALMEFLVRTYTNAGELVLDATMGSGSTGVAAVRCGRRFIGFEKEQKFFEVCRQRLSAEQQGLI